MDNRYKWHSIDIRLLAAGVSLLISGIMAAGDWMPNEDAFTYIRVVDEFTNNGLVAAFRHYPWATYPILIGVVHNVFDIAPFSAAIIVNAFFYSLLVYSFISLVAEFDSDRCTLLLAAITVLVYPQLNEYRLVIIRDSAFWALSLFGLWQYVRYTESRSLTHGILFSVSFLLGTAFRLEALVFLFAIPLSQLLDDRQGLRERIKPITFFTAGSMGILGLVAFTLSLAGLGVIQLVSDQIEGYLPFINDTFFPSELRTAEMGRVLFGEYAANFTGDYLPLFMFAGLFAIMVAFLIRGIGAPFLIIMAAGVINRTWKFPRSQAIPLITVIVVNGLIAFGFLITTRFLSTRYVMLPCLVLVVFLPLLIPRLLNAAKRKGRSKLIGRLVGLLLFYCAIDAYISFGSDHEYLREASDWIAQNTPESTILLTNSRAVAYYSGRVENYDEVPIFLTEEEILQQESGVLIGFEEDTSTIGLFEREAIKSAVEEVIRFGDDSDRQLIVFRRL